MQERLSRAQRLAQSLLRDRIGRETKPRPVRAKIEGSDFDPFAYTRWRVVAGGDPGYLVRTPVRQGPVGWFIACRHCGAEFESKGWGYCPACMELPAEARRSERDSGELLPHPQEAHSHVEPSNGIPTPQNAQKTQPIIGSQDWPVMVVGPRLPQHRAILLGRIRVRPWVT